MRLALTIRDGVIEADYAGTSPQQPRAINCPYIYTYAMTAYAVKCALLPNLPNNEGMFRPVKVTAPEGSILNPNPFNPATAQPWLTLCPSIAIFLTVFALNQFGEGLREATDPRTVR